MCKECRQTFCHSMCPNFETSGVTYRVKHCAACGGEIFAEDVHYLIFGTSYCKHCVEHARVSELAEFFEFPETKYLIEELGGEYCQD